MQRYFFSIIGALLAFTILLYSLLFDVDLFEAALKQLHRLEAFEVDEFIIPVVLLGVFISFDMVRSQKADSIRQEKLKIYQAMLHSTHHILNNFLNQMQLFRLKAQRTEGFDQEVLKLYDEILHDAQAQINALGSITEIDEKHIHASVAPKPAGDVQAD